MIKVPRAREGASFPSPGGDASVAGEPRSGKARLAGDDPHSRGEGADMAFTNRAQTGADPDAPETTPVLATDETATCRRCGVELRRNGLGAWIVPGLGRLPAGQEATRCVGTDLAHDAGPVAPDGATDDQLISLLAEEDTPPLAASEPRSGKRRLPGEVVAQALAEGTELVIVDGKADGQGPVQLELHPIDALLEDAFEAWIANPEDYRHDGQVVRDTLTDPANRVLVDAWLVEAGLAGGG